MGVNFIILINIEFKKWKKLREIVNLAMMAHHFQSVFHTHFNLRSSLSMWNV